jgi:hypothetical protein
MTPSEILRCIYTMGRCTESQDAWVRYLWNIWNSYLAKYFKVTHKKGATNPLGYTPEASVTILIMLVV